MSCRLIGAHEIVDLGIRADSDISDDQAGIDLGKLGDEFLNNAASRVRSAGHGEQDFKLGVVECKVSTEIFFETRVHPFEWFQNRNAHEPKGGVQTFWFSRDPLKRRPRSREKENLGQGPEDHG